MKQSVDVVALVICKDDKILVEKRKPNRTVDPGKVAIPGGHVEEHESLEYACKRELDEELGIKCGKFVLICKSLHCTDVEDQTVHYYLCEDWTGELESREAEKIFWVGPKELGVLDFEIDRIAAEKVFRQLKK